ncbi:ClpP/crotonase-like domain-containing protein [Mycena olivaceomarginata]|nr:ClpP/crotonase-like domain-containing protein [Mycena olivaceomarginata]
MGSSTITVDVADSIATITLCRPASLNALTADGDSPTALRTIDKRDDVLVTVWQATGKWFCAAAERTSEPPQPLREPNAGLRDNFLQRVVHTTTDCGQALYSHSKILVAALNGPVMAFLGYFDFIYCMENAWLSVPFTFLGIIAEGGSSVTFVNRMGIAKANEVLLWGKKATAPELQASGFINFQVAVRDLLLEELRGLDPTALLVVKRLLKTGLNEKNNPDSVKSPRKLRSQAERFSSGIPGKQFLRIANKEIKHKL